MLTNLIVPVLNRYDLLNRMLQSIDYPIQHLLIIDNGGKFQIEQTFEHVRKITVLNLPSNLGVAASWNLGIKLLPHDPVWHFASNDIVYRPGALQCLSEATDGSLSLSKAFPHFHTFAIGEEVIERVGLFDERYYPAFFEDNDMEYRVKMAGLPVAFLPIDTLHDNSSTLNSDQKFQQHNQRTFEANRNLYQRKIAGLEVPWSWSLGRRRAGEWLQID